MVEEIDQLQDFKSEFNKKCDFLSQKTDNLTALCNQTIEELVRKFERVQQPILSKVEDLKGVSELYRVEIERTQRTNREMLHTYGKLKSEISEVRREAADHLNRISLTDDACVISKSYIEPKSFMDPDISVASSPRQPNYYYGRSVMVEDNAPKSVTLDSTANETSLYMKANNSIIEGSVIERVAETRRKSETTETAGD